METIEKRQFKNLVAFRSNLGPAVAFHSTRLETALLSDEIWQSLADPSPMKNLQELLETWSAEKAAPIPVGRPLDIRALSLNVTQVCNLHCVYCAAGGDGSYGDPIKKISIEKTLPQIKHFIEKVPANAEFRITFLGGEPLLYPEAIEMIFDYSSEIAKANSVNLRPVVVTNGTLLNQKNCDLLCKMKAHVTVSLDGPAETNDLLRPNKGGAGSTDSVLVGLKNLLARKNELQSLGVSGVFGERNPDLVSAYRFYKSLGVDWFDFTYDHLETRPEMNLAFMDQLSQVAAMAFNAEGETGLRQIKIFDGYFTNLDQQIPNVNYCGAGKSFLMVDARNDIYTCPWEVGDKSEIVGSGTELWTDSLSEYQADLVESNNCQSCWARFVCGGGCMFIHKNKTGNKHQVDINFCKRTRHLIALSLMYYERSRSKNTNNNGGKNEINQNYGESYA